jgi:hypothetical protein
LLAVNGCVRDEWKMCDRCAGLFSVGSSRLGWG